MKKTASVVAVGIATRSHLAAASVSMASWHYHHSESARLLYVIDDDVSTRESPLLPERLPAQALLGPRFRSTAYALPAVGLCCALKPYAMLDALARTGAEKVVYFDGDVAWYSSPDTLLTALEPHSLVLTPHVLGPVKADALPDETVIRPYGIWNAGIIGARGDSAGRDFLHWWAGMMADPRRLRAETGWDQSWLDFAPVFAPSLGILRDPGYNVALWNLAERPLALAGDSSWTVGNQPLVSFHFSCFDESAPDRFKRAHITCTHPVSPSLARLGFDYSSRLKQARMHLPATGYRFNFTSDGQSLGDMHRSLLLENWGELPPASDPFAAAWRLPGHSLTFADHARARIRRGKLALTLKRAARSLTAKVLG